MTIEMVESNDEGLEEQVGAGSELSEGQSPEVESEEPVSEGQESDSFTTKDPSKLSPELRTVYKQLQADYTKKRQTEARLVRELQGKMSGYEKELGSAKAAVQWVQFIRSNPELVKMIEGYYKKQQQPQEETTDVDWSDEKSIKAYFGKLAETKAASQVAAIRNELTPLLSPLVNDMAQRRVNAEVSEMDKKYPGWDKHIDKILELRQTAPNLPLEQAFKLASFDSYIQANAKKSKQDVINSMNVKKKAAVISGQGAARFGTTEIFKTARDAVSAAVREHSEV